ncbi:MAG: germination protein YpeB [Clostridia bacterium]
MGKIKEKVYDWKNRLKDRHMLTLVVVLVTVIAIMGIYVYKREREYRQVSENNYNMAFFELVDYVQNVETYLAKSLISSTPEHGAETLTHVWREANLAQSYLARLPIGSEELANTSKFLNQVSDYSFSLSRKNIYNESLTQEDFKNLKELHDYSVELENTLNQLSADMNDGRIKWGELTNKGSSVFATQVSNISKDSFSNLEENFHEYAGLIYDGAFSEHLTSTQRKGLTGDNIEEEQAKQIAIHFLGADKIKEITANGISENTNMPAYDFSVKINGDQDKENSATISITQKGGHVIFMNYNREVEAETISQERADEIGKNFLAQKEFPNMKETYYLKQDGIVTINYASYQDSENGQVTMYPDLIKLKIALDNGEIMGIETTGYLNSHEQRNLPEVTITKEQAKQNLNKDLEIGSQALAVIPTQFQTEILCWEFKGKVDDTEFLVYINAQTGKEEDILVIKNTPNGTLTM